MVGINFEHVRFLESLIDWRILDLNSLMNFSKVSQYSNYESLKKLTHRLKEKNLIEIYRDPWNKKNYIYLSPLGEKIVSPNVSINIKRENLYHDSKVSALCSELHRFEGIVQQIELEHKYRQQNKKNEFKEIVPDAKLSGCFKGANFLAAIELEINQKESKRLLSKAEQYLKSSYYDHAFYFFPDEVLLSRYKKILMQEFGEKFNQKIFLFTASFVFKGKGSFRNELGVALGREQGILQLFAIEQLVPD